MIHSKSSHRARRLALSLGIPTVIALVMAGCATSDPGPATGDEASSNEFHEMLPDDIKQSGYVTVATDASFGPPWMYLPEGSDEFAGIDADLINAVGEILDIDIKIESLQFAGVIPGLESGRYDLAMVGMSDTEEREQVIDMIGYVIDGNAIIVKAGNPEDVTSLDDLCGKTVAAVTGTFQLAILEGQQEDCGTNSMEILAFPSKQDTFLQIKTDRVAATIDGYAVSSYLQANEVAGSEGIEMVETAEPLQIKGLGIGVAKGNEQLRDSVHAALNEMIANGTYGEILKKWDIESLGLKTAAINDHALTQNPHLKG